MPTPRLMTGMRAMRQTNPAGSDPRHPSDGDVFAGVVIRAQGNLSSFYTVLVDGMELNVRATIDAPVVIGDSVVITRSAGGWLLTGVR